MSDNGTLKVWVDFLCPWARIGALWLQNVDEAGGVDLDIEWKSFSLENINLPEDASADELWSTATERRGLIPAAAAKWVQTQAPERFRDFQRAMFDARHVEHEKIGPAPVTAQILHVVGLDGEAITKEILERVQVARGGARRSRRSERARHLRRPDVRLPRCSSIVRPSARDHRGRPRGRDLRAHPDGRARPDDPRAQAAEPRPQVVSDPAPIRYRCTLCGNLTRFDVIERKRSRSFYHYTLGGLLDVEEEEVLEREVEEVRCRWCNSATGVEEAP